MTLQIPGLPPLAWTGAEGAADIDESAAGSVLTMTSEPGVDWTNDALGGPQQQAATALGFVADGDFALSARVRVLSERSTFDAGVLAIWADDDHWAKICFEFSPQGEPMVVSVVTDVFSDDCNSQLVEGDFVFLRVVRTGDGWAFHSSEDGRVWRFVRLFRLSSPGPFRVGFLSQAPTGDACTAAFDEIAYTTTVPSDLRDGS
ncbi:DUF1349 domain-containing protein [Frondihabitans peucedani]|uniref:DUF1349 domain-containing protein n=1 Tax=Frondihabitans peucedani TaxID=598626 RepID=A0ABP8DXZ7_9MICO